MNDIEKTDPIPSTSTLAQQGITAIGCTAGGIFLFVMQAIARFRVLGLVMGAAACVVGIVLLLSKDSANRKPGAVITGAGFLVVLSKTGILLLKAAAGTLLSIGALGLLAMGIWNGIKFFIGLKKRS
ncbi:hypothetical protein AGMMS50293_28810 [Spirochaetia bacterium]|nr:hypothetical protein AGMMS50293_28810 [Spirochaetia bacterium]